MLTNEFSQLKSELRKDLHDELFAFRMAINHEMKAFRSTIAGASAESFSMLKRESDLLLQDYEIELFNRKEDIKGLKRYATRDMGRELLAQGKTK